MKRTVVFVLLLIIPFLLFAKGVKESESFIGVAVYRFDDPFITEIRTAIESLSQGKLPVRIVDCQNKQSIQNDVVADFLSSGSCKALVINTVDRTSSALLIEKAKRQNVPVVFFNREPLEEDMARWDKVYYVGADAKECGEMAGEIFTEYYKAHPEVDKNNDGIVQYVMIKGEPGHQDTELRTEYTINTLLENGIRFERLDEASGNWQRREAYAVMRSFLYSFGNQIEVVFANNDEMAIGAIEALKESGYFSQDSYIPVIGVDGTSFGKEALKNGTLLGTVFNDSYKQAEAIYNIAYELACGRTPTEEAISFPIVDNQYVWIPYTKLFGARFDY